LRQRFYSLSHVTARVQAILQPSMGKLFWVKAEISSGRERGGTFYCDLVESDDSGTILARMSCTIWSRRLASIREKFREAQLEFNLEDGTEAGLQCSIQYNPRYGLSLNVVDADPSFALGELELKRREILLRLEKDGLFESNSRLAVPLLPKRIGIITSKVSAAFNDFVLTLTRSAFGFRLLVADAVMQGTETERGVLRAMTRLESVGVDVVVIIRGGGSRSDLSYLDSEEIARRIAASPLPVWTGIGHEIDGSVLDFVAHRHFKTPTAVAEEIVARHVEVRRHLDEGRDRFRSTWNYRLEMEKRRAAKDRVGIRQGTRKLLDVTRTGLVRQKNELGGRVKDRLSGEKVGVAASRRLVTASARSLLRARRERLNSHKGEFIVISERYISLSYKMLEGVRARFRQGRFLGRLGEEGRLLRVKENILRANHPDRSLERGYSLVYNRRGLLVKSLKDVTPGESLETQVRDGVILSTVESLRKGEDGKEE
jgi:exodeoxyribonuclease VII large subunit